MSQASAQTPSPQGRERVSTRSLGIGAVMFATVAWGLVPLVLKQINMPTLAFTAWRLWLGVVVYGSALLVTRRRISRADMVASIPGGIFFAADISLTFGAFTLTSVANATIIGAIAPIFIALGAVRWFGERFSRRDVMSMGLSFVGVAVVAVSSAGSPSWSPLGDMLAALSTVSWAAYWLASKRAREQVGPLVYMASVQIVAAIAVTLVCLGARVSLSPPVGSDRAWLVLVVLVPGVTAHLMVAWSHRHVEAWLAALITQCMPVVGSAAAWIVLGESLNAVTIAGGLLVLGATATIVVRTSRSPVAVGTGSDEPPLLPDPTG